MKLLNSEFRKGFVKLQVEDLDDLWFLSSLISLKDVVTGKTTRKIKIGDGDNAKTVKKVFTLSLEVEAVEYGKHSDVLRIKGKVSEAVDDVPKGSYHSLNLEEGSQFSLVKEEFLDYQVKDLKEISSEKKSKILLCALDREDASFALLKKYGYQYLGDLFGEAEKKYVKEKLSKDFYSDVVKVMKEYVERYAIEQVVVGSPAFWKDELAKKMDGDLQKKVVFATCHASGKEGLNEILKREEIQSVLKNERLTKELGLVEELLKEISLEGKACYGFEDCWVAAESGAVQTLLVSDKLVRELREKEEFERLDTLMKLVGKMKGEVHILNSDFEAGVKLDGLTGVAALLRYAL